ncbi:Polyketide cyclase / dehydrase and lipid transport [Geodermatophilus amargosae]|uniref:Polyketide cyclase / dehydrase and lipid transport n=1 Tax=Geodermatophilus amargosae TaxID=1296565 RepID=A0A1I7BK96_9ACTN|nr:SRPBCC family protein [Geodermatophilus amargosae]SFT87531.1 Polyketide cyclase / dehydrase and lipid transport [Geodermatophilus amargosae]
MRLQAEIHIDAAPSDVFRFVATEHFDNHPRWDPSVVEMTPTSPGPVHQGATARLVRSDGGRRSEGFVTVTEYRPDSHFAAVVEMAPFRLEQQVGCSPGAAGGTHLLLIIDTRAKMPLNLLLPLMRPRFEKTMRASLRSIKRHVEERPPR